MHRSSNLSKEISPDRLEESRHQQMDFTQQKQILYDVIRQYKPVKREKAFDPLNVTKDGLKEVGLERMAKDLQKLSKNRFGQLDSIRAPKRQLFIMIIGNHSAGKSSFINWYTQDHIAKTNVSIETVDINLIMHGSRNTELSGINTMQEWPFLKELYERASKKERFKGLLKNLSIKTSTSEARNFENIVFIDTPGLADGGLQYKFDVDNVYSWFAKHCDLVLVFLDPVGMALCTKTTDFIQKLHRENCNAELKFFMTKGDIFKTEHDCNKCMVQITSALSSILPP